MKCRSVFFIWNSCSAAVYILMPLSQFSQLALDKEPIQRANQLDKQPIRKASQCCDFANRNILLPYLPYAKREEELRYIVKGDERKNQANSGKNSLNQEFSLNSHKNSRDQEFSLVSVPRCRVKRS